MMTEKRNGQGPTPIIIEFFYSDPDEADTYGAASQNTGTENAEPEAAAVEMLPESVSGKSVKAEKLLDDAVAELSVPFETLGNRFVVVKVNIINETLAEVYRITALPSVRVLMQDMDPFGDPLSDDKDIRARLIDGILEAVYADKFKNQISIPSEDAGAYVLPDTLRAGFAKKQGHGCPGACCGSGGCCGKKNLCPKP